MEFKKLDKELAVFLLVCFLVIGLFSYLVFGLAGFRVFLGMAIVSLPFHFILKNFGMGDGERLVLSLVFGITIFPSLVYALGLLISFRLAIAAVFVLLMIIAIIVWKIRKKKITSQAS